MFWLGWIFAFSIFEQRGNDKAIWIRTLKKLFIATKLGVISTSTENWSTSKNSKTNKNIKFQDFKTNTIYALFKLIWNGNIVLFERTKCSGNRRLILPSKLLEQALIKKYLRNFAQSYLTTKQCIMMKAPSLNKSWNIWIFWKQLCSLVPFHKL